MQEKKADIRKNILRLLRNQKEEDRLSKSLVILKKLFALPEFQKIQKVLFYVSFNGEVDTYEMMKQAQKLGKEIVAPTILKQNKEIIPILIDNLEEDLENGLYGIKQPRYNKEKEIKLEDLDMIIVPGIAFDKTNVRLGRGGGYYDRFLEALPDNIPTVGLAFDFQVVDSLPKQDHDIPVSLVISN